VPIPRFLVDELAAHVAGKAQDDLVFAGRRGGAIRAQSFQRTTLTAAAEKLSLSGLHPHELRHTAASLAIASGATIKVVQQMLGHKSAIMTLDFYGDTIMQINWTKLVIACTKARWRRGRRSCGLFPDRAHFDHRR
jgi:site-specific recombinase XerD